MKKSEDVKLRERLAGTLTELDRLVEQIRSTQDYSESSELVLCLRELVLEQMESKKHEDSRYTAHQIG